MQKKELSPQRGFFPQPLYLIGTNINGFEANFSIVSWITFASVNPPKILIACRGNKLTKKLIEKNKTFSANLVTKKMLKITDYFGTHSGLKENKCENIHVDYTFSRQLHVPIIDESPYVFECEVSQKINNNEVDIFIGKIKSIYIDNKIIDTNYQKIDLLKLNPLIYAPGFYYELGDVVGEVGKLKE